MPGPSDHDGGPSRAATRESRGGYVMKVKHKDVRVRISRRILWVGPQAYPLSQVVRVHPVQLRLKRVPILVDFGRRSGATIALAVLGVIAMACLGRTLPIAVWV